MVTNKRMDKSVNQLMFQMIGSVVHLEGVAPLRIVARPQRIVFRQRVEPKEAGAAAAVVE